MNESIAILGRQPSLGVAELESLYGGDRIIPLGTQAAHLNLEACLIDFSRLGGTVKLCKLLTIIDGARWSDIERFLLTVAPAHTRQMPEGKMRLGLSTYDIAVSASQLLATGLNLKKAIRKVHGRSVRLVPNKTTDLNAAQVIHNKLTDPTGWELVFVREGHRTYVAQTVAVQDIESYTVRDRQRPKRDPRVGMLPPKLAQQLINLAVGPAEFAAIKDTLSGGTCLSTEDNQRLRAARTDVTLLDPFCGTGVVLQEALLMGYSAYGTDIERRMATYTATNLEWLRATYRLLEAHYRVEAGDATSYQWQQPVSFIACESYLGRPFTTPPTPEILAQTTAECNLIIKKFLKNLHGQLAHNARLCIGIPAWQVKPGQFRYLPLIDQLSDLGYNRIRFKHVRDEELLYYRADQIVARQLLVITRK